MRLLACCLLGSPSSHDLLGTPSAGTLIYIYIYMYICICIRVCVYIYIYIYIYMYMCVCIYIYIYFCCFPRGTRVGYSLQGGAVDEVSTWATCCLDSVVQDLLYDGNPMFDEKLYFLFGLGFEIEKTNYLSEYFVGSGRGVQRMGVAFYNKLVHHII